MMKFTALVLVMASAIAVTASELTFEQKQIEVTAKLDETSINADFTFKNEGDATVKIVRFDSACSCLKVGATDNKLEYAPGESGSVRAVFDLGTYSGTVDKTVSLWIQRDGEEPTSTVLTVRIHIPVLISLTPKTLSWEVGEAPKKQTITLDMNEDMKIRVLNAISSSESFKLDLRTVEEGRKYEIDVTPTGTEAPGMAIFRIETDSTVERQRLQQAFGVIRNPPRQPK